MKTSWNTPRGCMIVDWPTWDPVLIKMWTEGAKIMAIAEAIPLATRHSVVGRRMRLRLPERGNPVKLDAPAKAAWRAAVAEAAKVRPPKSGAAAVSAARVASMRGKSLRKAEPPPAVSYKPPATPAPTKCQWPLTDGRPWRFCDAGVARGSYCAEHGGLAYTQPSEWAKRTHGT